MSTGFRWQVLSWGSWVKSIQFPKEVGFFPPDFASFHFIWKAFFCLWKNCWIWLQPFTSKGGRFPDGYTRERAVQLFGQPNISFQNMRKVYSFQPNQKFFTKPKQKVKQFERFTSPKNNFHINGFTNSKQLIQQLQPNHLILSQNLTRLDLSWLWSSNIATWEQRPITPWRFWYRWTHSTWWFKYPGCFTNLHHFQVRKVLKETCLKTMSMEYLQLQFPWNCRWMESTVLMVFDDKVDD